VQLVACAIVHDDPPSTFIADDTDTLHWVIALHIIASTHASELNEPIKSSLRQALLDERWGDAVELWLEVSPYVIDVYPSYELYTQGDVALGAQELQFTPLFED